MWSSAGWYSVPSGSPNSQLPVAASFGATTVQGSPAGSNVSSWRSWSRTVAPTVIRTSLVSSLPAPSRERTTYVYAWPGASAPHVRTVSPQPAPGVAESRPSNTGDLTSGVVGAVTSSSTRLESSPERESNARTT